MSSLTKKELTRRFQQEGKLSNMGFTSREAEQLRRISNQIQHWYERECNGTVERDEATGKTFTMVELYNGKLLRYRCNDLETGAIKRLDTLMANHPEWIYYLQTDPKGGLSLSARRQREYLPRVD